MMVEDTERFEDQLAKLEEIVRRLEDEHVGLEEAVELFEQGMKLAKACRARLREVEQKVEQLLAEGETEPLEVEGTGE